MSKVSILIPARGETPQNLGRTLDSIWNNATGDYEVIVGFDGSINYPLVQDQWPKMDISVVAFPRVVGIKTNINALASMATGKYLYKSDAHCAFGKGFDEILKADMQDDWIMMPRFKILTSDWQIQKKNGEVEFYDYFYLCCPFTDPRGFRFKAGGHWPERTKERLNGHPEALLESHPHLDETPQIHGSGWMMTRDYYFDTLHGFPNIDPHGHAQEPIWLALKAWLAGGKVIVNKKTWYAHMHQQGNKRGYHMDRAQENRSYKLAADFFVGDTWFEGKKHNLEWFVDKFMPMPTWPDDWRITLKGMARYFKKLSVIGDKNGS